MPPVNSACIIACTEHTISDLAGLSPLGMAAPYSNTAGRT